MKAEESLRRQERVAAVVELCASIQEVQREILTAITRRNAGCAYGVRHGFSSIENPDDWRRLPLMNYDSAQAAWPGYWDDPATFTTDRLLVRFLTSGSTAEPKRIPVTSSLVREKSRAFGLFWDSIYASHPALLAGNFIANFADSGVVKRDANNVQMMSETTFWNRRMQGFQDPGRWPLGRRLPEIPQATDRYYAAARIALQGPLHCMMSLNPSTLVRLCQTIEQEGETLADGLRSGAWGGDFDAAAKGVPAALQARLAANPRAAEQLSRVLSRGGRFRLRDLWPELELIICWQSSLVEPYLHLLREHADGIAFRDYITQSSECVMAVPLHDGVSGGLLAFTSHFFEFVPAAEAHLEVPPVLYAWELKEGESYEPVVTTGGGLYRYRTGDCVRVTGFVAVAPLLEFRFRLGNTSSMTGEKLTEAQVLAAFAETNRQAPIVLAEAVVFPRTDEQPHYGVMVPARGRAAAASPGQLATWLALFEAELGRANGEYADKRGSLRLGGLRLLRIAERDFAALEQRRKPAHIGDDQFKPAYLRRERDLDHGISVLDEIRAHP